MIQAELHGKVSSKNEYSEDFLTSNVFSFLNYADRKIYLKEFMKKIGFNPTDEEVEEAKFLFWHIYEDLTEPDVIIICGEFYLLFEAKFWSDFGKDKYNFERNQVNREIRYGLADAEKMNKKFYYFAVTKDYFFNKDKYTQLRDVDKKFIRKDHPWINWQLFTNLLDSILKSQQRKNLFANDVYALLLKKGLVTFNNFKNLKSLKSILKFRKSVFFGKSTLFLDTSLKGYKLRLNSTKSIKRVYKKIFFSRDFNLFSNRVKGLYNHKVIFYGGV